MEKKKKIESMVRGLGYGDCHTWYEFKFTGSENHITPYTTWKCKKCFVMFNHMYNYIPNIFTAMEACNVPNICSRKLEYKLLKYDVTGIRRADREK